MRAIDLFAGFGGLTEGARQAGVEVVWAANHWPSAVRTHELNHPEAQHVQQDLNQADWTSLPDYDLLLSAPACFAADVTVVTERGVLPISEVQVGDRALTHKGRWRPVTAVMSRRAETVRVNYTETTADHRYLSRERHQAWNNASRRYDWSLGPCEWTSAAKLHQRFVAIPTTIGPGNVPDYAADRPETFWYLVGRWLGDGWIRHQPASAAPRSQRTRPMRTDDGCVSCGGPTPRNKRYPHLFNPYCSTACSGRATRGRRSIGRYSVSICCSHDEADGLEAALAATGMRWSRRAMRTTAVFTAHSRPLVEFLLAFGRGAAHKRLPGWALGMGEAARTALLEGYLAADGHKRFNGWKVSTVGKQLAVSMRLLASTLGYTTNLSCTQMPKTTVIEGRTVNQRPLWTLGLVDDDNPERYTRVIDGLRWMKQRSPIGPGRDDVEVYDLTVEEDHSFVADGVVVHNCQGHSTASQPKRRTYHDAMRSTAMAVVDCADVTNPKAIVVENVPSFTRWRLFGWWCEGLERLGYQLDLRVVIASHHGVPQRRKRLFIIGTRKGVVAPPLPAAMPEPAFGPCIETDVPDSAWRLVDDATPRIKERIRRSRERHGDRFLTQHTSDHMGVPLHEPIRTITTAPSHWNLVDGDRYRTLTGRELARGMGFPDHYIWPDDLTVEEVTQGLGNAVPPPVGAVITTVAAHAAAA